MRSITATFFLLLAVVLCCAGAAAATQQGAVNALQSGEYETALQMFQELQLENPDNPDVLYGLGCVQYQRGLSRSEVAGGGEDAQTAFQEARAAFGGVLAGAEKRLHADAAFNLANVLAKEAELVPEEDFDAKIGKYREAIAAYDRVVVEYPGHPGAQHNLDYVRYRLKQLLQQAQEQEEQQEQQEQPRVMTVFQFADTDIPGAEAVPRENVVELRRPGRGGQGGVSP